MKYEPHKYQSFATDYVLDHKACALFLDLGLGKSVITLTALTVLFERGEIQKVLIIAPLRVARSTWPMEILKWDHTRPLFYSVAVGKEKERIKAIEMGSDVTIINRENVDWLTGYFGPWEWPYDCVVVDELSSFKNHKSKRYKAIMSVRPFIKRIIGLTGTPASNGLEDLWAQIKILDFGQRLGRFITQYRDRYFVPEEFNPATGVVYKRTPRPGAKEMIFQKISDITVSMSAVENLDMPEVVYSDYPVFLLEERALYDQLKRELAVVLNNEPLTAANAAVLSNKLRQMADGVVYLNDGEVRHIHTRKLDALEDLIESANGASVLVAYSFRHEMEEIKERLPVARMIDKDRDISDWNKGEISIGLLHPASVGYGVNLQAGGHILIWYGLTWSLEEYQQTVGRLWRQGQKHPVSVVHLMAKDTIDERIREVLKKKDRTQNDLLNAVKAEIIS